MAVPVRVAERLEPALRLRVAVPVRVLIEERVAVPPGDAITLRDPDGIAERERVELLVALRMAVLVGLRDGSTARVGVEVPTARVLLVVADIVLPIGLGRTLEDTVPSVPCPPMGLIIRNKVSSEVNNLICYIECKICVNEVIGE